MGDKTGIEWTDATWNPVRGCSRLSPGCGGANHQGGCYAEKIAARFSEPGMPFHGFAERTPHGGRWTGKVALVPDMLGQPLRWKKPRRIFVNSMSDLFHENLAEQDADRVFAVMALAPQHTFQILTKRAEWMRRYFEKAWPDGVTPAHVPRVCAHIDAMLPVRTAESLAAKDRVVAGPLPNVWLGVSVEGPDQKERIDHLRATPAAVRFLSLEPLLEDPGPLNLAGINQVIVGGESGPRSRPFWVPNARSVLRQCRKQGVACFIKQMGANVRDRNDAGFDGCDNSWCLDDEFFQVEHDVDGYRFDAQGAPCRIRLRDRKGGDMAEWPADLRVRAMPA